MDALVDLTGGLAERYDVKEYDPTIYHLILHAHRSGAFIACAKKVIKKPTKNSVFIFNCNFLKLSIAFWLASRLARVSPANIRHFNRHSESLVDDDKVLILCNITTN